MNQSWTHKNIARSVQFSPKGVLLWPTSDTAPNGWGAPFDAIPGTVGGDRPNVLLTYSDPTTVKIKRGLARSDAGNCYWRSAQGRITSWQGPWGFQVTPPIYFLSADFKGQTTPASVTRAANALIATGYAQTTVYAPASPASPTGAGHWVVYGSRFSTGIYQGGKLIATAPYAVLGAAELNTGLIAILVDGTIRYKIGQANWVTIGNVTDPTIADTSKTLLPHLGIFSFDADGLHAIAIRSVICPADTTGPDTSASHIETILTRLEITEGIAGNLSGVVSHTAPDAATIIKSVNLVSTYSPPPAPWTDGGSGDATVTESYSTQGETALAAGFNGNTEVVLSAKVYDTSLAISSTSSGHGYGNGGSNGSGALTASGGSSGANKAALFKGATKLVDLMSYTSTSSSSSSEATEWGSHVPLDYASASYTSSTDTTREVSKLLFADVSSATPVYSLVKTVTHSDNSGNSSFTLPPGGTKTGSSTSSGTYSVTCSVVNPSVTFPPAQDGPTTNSSSGDTPDWGIEGLGFNPGSTENITTTDKTFDFAGLNTVVSYGLPSGEYVTLFPTCYGVVDHISGFWATVHFAYTTDFINPLLTTTPQLPNGLTPAVFLGLTGTNQDLGNPPSKGVYLF